MGTILPAPGSTSPATSKRASVRRAEVRYIIEDEPTIAQALTTANTVFTNTLSAGLATLNLVDLRAEEFEGIDDQWIVTGEYELLERRDPPVTGAVEQRFNFQAQGGHFYTSLSTVNSYGTNPPDFKQAINVVKVDGTPRVEGANVSPPPETFTIAFFPANASVSDAYIKGVYDLVGAVNNASYNTFAAGELMLVRCAGGIRTNADFSIEFGFSYIPNTSSLSIGGIGPITKDGHDLLWAYFEDVEDTTNDALVKNPTAIYIERVWNRGDFTDLSLGTFLT